MKNPLILAAVLLCGSLTPSTGLELGAPFTDHAVLQRQMPVPVWGWSPPGIEVTVEFADQRHTTTAGEDGKWFLTLTPLEASAEPRTMTVSENGGESRTIEDLLVGEVWMASGQSNMQWHASKSSVANLVSQLSENNETPPIREFEVTSVYASLHPVERATGEWKRGNYGDYSAVAFAFALKLHQELGVPIGILNCSFSQTSIESWVPREGFADGTDDHTRSIHQRILETDPSTPEHKAAWDAFYQSLEDTLKANAERIAAGQPAVRVSTATPGNMRGNRDASWMFNGRMSPVVPYAIRGAIWNQGYANMGDGLRYYHNLHSLVRGWRIVWDNPTLPVYFHQFYCPGNLSTSGDTSPDIGPTAEMRLGTWLARDIPHTGMASQIDIEGAIHYNQKALPGQRLALHALKNDYGRDVVADGPMFKSYTIEGDKLIVEFEHAEGGLIVAETLTNSPSRPSETSDGLATPKLIPDGASQVNHFHLAGEDRVWHPATIRIDGSKVIVTSPAVKEPRGVSCGTGGIGFRPGLYNQAMLPATPFIYFDNQLVTSESWPDQPMKIAGVEIDPDSTGLVYEFRKMPLLSTQFRENAILQAEVPVTIFGSAVLYPGHPSTVEGEAVIHFKFGDIEHVIPVKPDMQEWTVTLPAMPAGNEPHTLEVSFHVDGEPVHSRVVGNILFGDVWYVASPPIRIPALEIEDSDQIVRVMTRRAKRTSAPNISRFTVSTSTDHDTRFSSLWEEATDTFASALGHRLAKQSGRPTGIIHMDGDDVPLASWIPFSHLRNASTLIPEYENLAQIHPGNDIYDANVRRYIADWRGYWGDHVPRMIATRAAPDGAAWGSYPALADTVVSKASQTHNVLAASFIPGSFKGVVFLTSPAMVAADEGAAFGPEFSVLANSLITDFGGQARFVHTMPDRSLAPRVTAPAGIHGDARAIVITEWDNWTDLLDKLSE